MDHATTCLAQGLKSIGVPLFSNIETAYSQQLDMPEPCPFFCVFNVTEYNETLQLMQFIESSSTKHKIILCMADTISTIVTPQSVPALMTHENRFRKVKGLRIPWAFGMTQETVQNTMNGKSFSERSETIIRNFRPSKNQQVRNSLDLSFVLNIEERFCVDSDISSQEEHNDKLKSCIGCLAYGGSFDEDLLSNPHFANQPGKQLFYGRFEFKKPVVILRWDSFRWWESLSAGCLTFNLDFDKYGFALPEMPVGWEHYIPIDLADTKGTVDRLMAERDRWEEIANNGRIWVHEHYSPEAVAQRFLKYVEVLDRTRS